MCWDYPSHYHPIMWPNILPSLRFWTYWEKLEWTSDLMFLEMKVSVRTIIELSKKRNTYIFVCKHKTQTKCYLFDTPISHYLMKRCRTIFRNFVTLYWSKIGVVKSLETKWHHIRSAYGWTKHKPIYSHTWRILVKAFLHVLSLLYTKTGSCGVPFPHKVFLKPPSTKS